jgi:hypothetical protein
LLLSAIFYLLRVSPPFDSRVGLARGKRKKEGGLEPRQNSKVASKSNEGRFEDLTRSSALKTPPIHKFQVALEKLLDKLDSDYNWDIPLTIMINRIQKYHANYTIVTAGKCKGHVTQWELIEMGYEDGKDPKSKRYQHSRMSTYPNNSVRCHFEDDLEIFLDKLDGYEWKKSFQPFLERVKKAHANSEYLMMEKDNDSAPDIATKHTAY